MGANSQTAKGTEVEIGTSSIFETWTCTNCQSPTEFVILNIMRGKDDYGEESSRYGIWGNPDYKPFCPHCGSKEKVSR